MADTELVIDIRVVDEPVPLFMNIVRIHMNKLHSKLSFLNFKKSVGKY